MTMALAKIETGLEKLAEINDPVILSNLYDQWKNLKEIGDALEKKIKGIITSQNACGDYFFETQNGDRKFTDPSQAELIAGQVMAAQDIKNCTELKVSALEKAFVEKIVLQFGCTKEEAKAEFAKRFAPVIEQGTKKVLKRRQLSLAEAIDNATINPEF